MCGATAALAGVILLGARKGKYNDDGSVNAIPGANMPLATLGTFILWFGWFGFNGGSELIVSNVVEANAVALIFVTQTLLPQLERSQLSSLIDIGGGKADLTMALNGALAGLVSITAEPLTPTPGAALLIGAAGGAIVYFSILAFDKVLKIDDPVGAISVHGTCGIWGLIAVCFTNGDASIGSQLMGIAVIFLWTFVTAGIVWMILKVTIGIRISEAEEEAGADATDIGIEAYPSSRGKDRTAAPRAALVLDIRTANKRSSTYKSANRTKQLRLAFS